MAKKIIGQIKLQLSGGQATPAPPVGPALGQHGLNIMDFCKAFNARTQKEQATPIARTPSSPRPRRRRFFFVGLRVSKRARVSRTGSRSAR